MVITPGRDTACNLSLSATTISIVKEAYTHCLSLLTKYWHFRTTKNTLFTLAIRIILIVFHCTRWTRQVRQHFQGAKPLMVLLKSFANGGTD
jgi:hypothetical protein